MFVIILLHPPVRSCFIADTNGCVEAVYATPGYLTHEARMFETRGALAAL
jgi:hypothetical protein